MNMESFKSRTLTHLWRRTFTFPLFFPLFFPPFLAHLPHVQLMDTSVTRWLEQTAEAVVALGLVYEASTYQGRAPPLVPLKEFYNDGVNSMISLKEDYRRWRRRVAMREDAGQGGAYWREGKDSERPSFAFCEHPYVWMNE